MKRLKAFFVTILVLLLLAALAYGGVHFFSRWQEKRIALLELKILDLKREFVPMRFRVVSRDENSLQVDIRFYDMEGKSVGTSFVSLPGSQLYVDVGVVKHGNNGFLFFPSSIFTQEIAAQNAMSLLEIYNDNGFPAIYNQWEVGKVGQFYLRRLYQSLRKGVKKHILYGSAVHDIKDIAELQVGLVYDVVCHLKQGGVEIVLQ